MVYGWYSRRSQILHVRCERRPSNSDFRAFSCCAVSVPLSYLPVFSTNLVCLARARLLVALGRHLLLEAVAAGGARRPVDAGVLDEPGRRTGCCGRAPSRSARGRRHALCLPGRPHWRCARSRVAVHGGRVSATARCSVEEEGLPKVPEVPA